MSLLLGILLLVSGVDARGAGRGADGTFDKRTSSHFALYQDVDIDQSGGIRGARRFEQEVLRVLESAYDQLDRRLGLRPRRRIDVVVYDPGVFDREFGQLVRFPLAGFYHGVIRVRGDTRVHVAFARVLHHELVHAAFDALAPSYAVPGWLNEGMAEWFEARALGKRHLTAAELDQLVRARRQGQLLPSAELGAPGFGHLPPAAARLAYLQSYALIELVARHHGERALRELCLELVRTRNLARTLSRVLKTDLAKLEQRLRNELR